MLNGEMTLNGDSIATQITTVTTAAFIIVLRFPLLRRTICIRFCECPLLQDSMLLQLQTMDLKSGDISVILVSYWLAIQTSYTRLRSLSDALKLGSWSWLSLSDVLSSTRGGRVLSNISRGNVASLAVTSRYSVSFPLYLGRK